MTEQHQKDDRAHSIDAWWDLTYHPGLPRGSTSGDRKALGRLHKAFRRVLSVMSEEHWQKFWFMNPTVICLSDYGRVFQQRPGNVPVIYINTVTLKWTDERFVNNIAHEVAHIILGHHEQLYGSNSKTEKAADDLAERWGFKRQYTAHDLKSLRAAERRR